MKKMKYLLKCENELIQHFFDNFSDSGMLKNKISKHIIARNQLENFRNFLIDNLDLDEYETKFDTELQHEFRLSGRRYRIEENILERTNFEVYLQNRGIRITEY